MEMIDGSSLDQALAHLGGSLYEIAENPFCYPEFRLDRLFESSNSSAIQWLDGFCHFHPTGSAQLSRDDIDTLPRIASVMRQYGKESVTSIVFALRDHLVLETDARLDPLAFVDVRIARAKDVLWTCVCVTDNGSFEECELLL